VNLYLLDTNIVSDMMRDPQGRAAQRAIEISRSVDNAYFHTSVIVDCEIRYGLTRKPLARLQAAYLRTMATLTIVPLDLAMAQTYADLRHRMTIEGIGLDANDALIAAHAISLNATLVSADAAFTRVPGLRCENWLADPDPSA
jgi:tRNA(fMet)-specific endonuclease VapC